MDKKPYGVTEVDYEGVTLLTSVDAQVMITLEPVGSTTMFIVRKCIRTRPGLERGWGSGPAELEGMGAFVFYGKALRVARELVGWDWVPHPAKPKDVE